MGKSKEAKSATHGKTDPITSVKTGAITKPSQTPKAKSKGIAKAAALAQQNSKKAKESSSEASSDSDEDSDDDSEDDSEDESDVTSEPEIEAKESVKKSAAPNGVKANGVAKATAQAESETSDSSESSDSESESDDEKPPAAVKAAPAAKAKAAAKDESSGSEDDSSEDDSEDSSDDDGSEEEAKVVKAAVADNKKVSAKAVPKVPAAEDDDSDSDDSEDDSEDDSSESEEEAPAPKKRKAEAEEQPFQKKARTDPVGDASKCNLFVGHLSWNIDTEWLTREFEQFGEMARVDVMLDRETGRSRGFGYVEFKNGADGERAQAEMNGLELDGRAINVDFSKPKTPGPPREERAKQYGDRVISPPSSTLFIANISFSASSEVIGNEFGKHGDVIGVRLPTDRESGELKGFGYVEFSSVDEAKKAFDGMSGASIAGRAIRLDYSTPRDGNSGGGSGDRGGRGGGRGGFRGRGGGDRGGRGRGGDRGGRGGSFNRGGFGDFKGKKMSFD